MSSDFLQQRHAAYHTPDRIIFDLVRQATGQRAMGFDRFVRGYEHEVYAVCTSHNEFIMRIRRHGEYAMRSEAWALRPRPIMNDELSLRRADARCPPPASDRSVDRLDAVPVDRRP